MERCRSVVTSRFAAVAADTRECVHRRRDRPSIVGTVAGSGQHRPRRDRTVHAHHRDKCAHRRSCVDRLGCSCPDAVESSTRSRSAESAWGLGIGAYQRHSASSSLVRAEVANMKALPSNNTLERTGEHREPRLAAARSSWPAAQLGRWASWNQHPRRSRQEVRSWRT